MKLLMFLTWREIRFRWKTLLPFVLISAALIFALVSHVTCLECGNSVAPEGYMLSETNIIMFAAYCLIGYVSSKTFFTLYRERTPVEIGILQALGMKKRQVCGSRILLGCACILLALMLALPAALLYMYLFVERYASGIMGITDFVPLVFKIPVLNIIAVLVLILSALTAGVIKGGIREKNISALLRSDAQIQETENGEGELPEEGSLADYGKLYVKRSLRRSVRFNLMIAVLLVLPVVFLLGMTSVKMDRNTFVYRLLSDSDTALTETMIGEIGRIPGVLHAEGTEYPAEAGRSGFMRVRIYADEGAELPILRERVRLYAENHSVLFEDSAAIREESNRIAGFWQTYFMIQSGILFAAGYITSFAVLQARLNGRKKELSLLRAMGARKDDIMDAVIPETVADYIFGAFVSILIAVLGVMSSGGGGLDPVSVLVICFLFLAGNVFLQVRTAGRMTSQILSDTDARV